MAIAGRRRRIIVVVLMLMVSHLIALACGGIYVLRLLAEGEEHRAYACMMAARIALEDNKVEDAMPYLAVAQSAAPDWCGPLALSAQIYEQKGWPELAFQYYARAKMAMSADPKAEAGQPWYDLVFPLMQGIDQKIEALEEKIAAH